MTKTTAAMEQQTGMTDNRGKKPRIRSWMVGAVVALLVIALAAFSTQVRTIAEVTEDAAPTFDPAVFAEEKFASEIVPQIESQAVDLATLLADLAGGADPADFGNSSGVDSAFAFPITLTAVVGTPVPPVAPLTVEGVPSDIAVVLQIGPALNGTALRDVTGTISFNQFGNQLEYQDVGTELNNQVRENVLAGIDTTALEGKTVEITGTFLRVNPAFVSIIPVRMEVLP